MSGSEVRAGRAFVEVFLKNMTKEGARSIQSTLSAISTGVKTFGGSIAAAGAAATASFGGILGALAWPTKLAADMETTRAGFQAMLGDVGKVNKVMGDLQKFAAATPFEFPELADSARKLMAFGVTTDELIDTLRAVGDVSSGIGAPLGEIAEIFGKAKVQGRLFMEDINQLTGRGIPIIQELSKQFGVAESEVKKLVESGQVNFANLEQAFKSLTSKGGIFANQMAIKAQTLTGLFSSMKDAISAAILPIGEELVKAIKPIVVAVTSILIPVGEFISKNRQMVTIIAAVAAAGVAVGGVLLTIGGSIFAVGAALGGLAGMIPAIIAGLTAIGSALVAAAPVIAAVVAGVVVIGAAVGGVAYLAYQSGLLKEAFNSLMGIASILGKTLGQTFSGVSQALMDGNITQAVNTLWAGIKLAFLQGAKYALQTISWLANNMLTIMNKMGEALYQTMISIFKSLGKIAKAFFTGSGSISDILATAISQGVGAALDESIAAAQAKLDQLTAQQMAESGSSNQGTGSTPSKLKTPEQLKADEAAAKATEAYDDRKKALEEEIQELRLGADAADLAKLAQQGLNAEQLESIKTLQAQRDAAKAAKKAEEDAAKAREDAAERAKQLADEVATPLQKFQDKLDEIAALESSGDLTRDTASKLRQKAASEMLAPIDQRQQQAREAILNGRNDLVTANSQAAFDMIRAAQRQAEVSRLGLDKKPANKLEELAGEQVKLLRQIAANGGDGGKIELKTRRI